MPVQAMVDEFIDAAQKGGKTTLRFGGWKRLYKPEHWTPIAG
jgi:hypothetical protein